MSSMAKIFVVVNLVLAIVAFGSAATLLGAQDDYKSALETANKEFEGFRAAKEKQIDGLNDQLGQQIGKASNAVGKADSLEAERNDLNKRLAESENANKSLKSTVETFTEELKAANKINQDNKDWLDKQAEEAKTATQEMLNSKKGLEDEITNRVRLEQQVSLLNDQVQELSANKGDLERALREANFWIGEYRKRYGDLTGVAKGADGRVQNVRDNLVVISVGSKDGVRVGDTYHLRRGATYVGQIRIDKVEANMAVGVFDNEFAGDGAPPQTGDVAYTGNR